MRILVYAADPADRKLARFLREALARGPGLELEVLPFSGFARTWKKKAPGAFIYFDADAGLDRARLLDIASKLSTAEGCSWGLVDRAGTIDDPAALFFMGAKDYIGPRLFRAGLSPERLERLLAYAGAAADRRRGETAAEAAEVPFPGWNGLVEGDEIRVRFCYAAVGNQRELLERIGENRLNKLKEDFASFLETWAKECGGIEWIREKSGNLLLFPPRDEGMNPILAAFRLLLDRALIGYEVFRLETPLTFRFAFHAGSTMWRPPGATGTVVSDDVNFIFHLGTKAAEDGAIQVSDEAERWVPACLRDLFSPAGDFEGRSLFSSKRFRD
jgi:hypothetical protein